MSKTLKFGDPVRTKQGATGRYINDNVVLYVSAQDNDLSIASPDFTKGPWKDSPLPTMEECYAFRMGLTLDKHKESL